MIFKLGQVYLSLSICGIPVDVSTWGRVAAVVTGALVLPASPPLTLRAAQAAEPRRKPGPGIRAGPTPDTQTASQAAPVPLCAQLGQGCSTFACALAGHQKPSLDSGLGGFVFSFASWSGRYQSVPNGSWQRSLHPDLQLRSGPEQSVGVGVPF